MKRQIDSRGASSFLEIDPELSRSFPLTPALSLGERDDFVASPHGESRLQRGRRPNYSILHRSCSLSLRERVRVRGNERFSAPGFAKNDMPRAAEETSNIQWKLNVECWLLNVPGTLANAF